MSEASKDLGPTEKITKFDAARRQLHTAIRLFFECRDLVSVLTLSRASHDILRTLLISKGGGSFIKDSEYIEPNSREEISKILNHPSNFFKHADRDPGDVLTFYHMICPILLMDCCMMYQKFVGKFSRECAVFSMWNVVHYPHFLSPESEKLIRGLLDSGMVSKTVISKEFCLQAIEKPALLKLPNIGAYEDELSN